MVSFLYGMFIPLLFPVTLIGILNIYVTDRILLAYYFKQPPHIDMELQISAVRILKFSPVFMFLIGYWAMGNRQIFENVIIPLNNSS